MSFKSKFSVKDAVIVFIIAFFIGVGGGWLYERLTHKDNGIEMIDDHPAVDLGLSVKWAALNIGAESLDDYGRLASYEEAQRLSWGGRWRFPTADEWRELFNKCSQTKGVNGTVLTGPSGAKMFLSCDSLSNYSYWSSTPGEIGIKSHEGADSSKIECRSGFIMNGIAIFQGFPIPETSPNVATRLVCE